ncbi:MAG TPA: hypothetical protein VJR89_38025 [Polyangiales bacterium]|nr:hypothetical protein [Polyangiales bacterium]
MDLTDYAATTRIAYEGDGCVIAVWQDISMGIWGKSATLPLILELEKVRELISSQYPKTSSVHVLVNDAGPPQPDARKKLEEITAKSEGRLIGVATVVPGAGFRVSAMRGFLTGLHWLQRRPYSARVCSSVREGAEWLAPLHSAHSVATDAGALERLLLQLCERPSVARSNAA